MLIESCAQAAEKGAFQLAGYVTNIIWTADEMQNMLGRGTLRLDEIPAGRLWTYSSENRKQLYFQIDGTKTESLGPEMYPIRGCVSEVICTSSQQARKEAERTILRKLGFELNNRVLYMAAAKPEGSAGVRPSCLRKATAEDAETVLRLYNASFDPLTDSVPDRRQLEDDIAHGRVLVMARGEGDPRVVGTIQAQKNGRRTFLRHLAIDPAWRGHGYGGAIMTALLEELQPGGKAVLWVKEDNEKAIRLYRHIGYEQLDRRMEIWTKNG